MEVKDNFLGQKEFDELQTFMMGDDFAWFYQKTIDSNEDVDKFQFTHMFYINYVPISISALDFDSANTDLEYFTATAGFRYTNYEIKNLLNN